MVRTLELHLVWIKKHFLVLRFDSQRLARGRPELPVIAVLDIDPCSPLVQAGIGLPARQRKLAPLAVSASDVGDQHAGVALRKYMHLRDRALHRHAPGCAVDKTRPLWQVCRFVGMRVFDGRVLRDFFLQQQFHALDALVGVEPSYHHVIQEVVAGRQQDHALVVRHIG